MARVTVEQSQKIVRSSKGVKMFKFEPGGLYHVLFLGEKTGETESGEPIWDPIMYMNPTHNVRKDGKGFEVRCANEKYNISDVVPRDKDGKPMIDPRSGKVFNDGTCPYCELNKLFTEMVFKDREAKVAAGELTDKKSQKEYLKKRFEVQPVTPAAQSRVMLVAVFELDQKGKPVTDTEGNKVYQIVGMEFSEHRFTNKLLEQVELVKMGLDDENDKGIAWHEYYFKFPKADNKMLAGKDLSISPVGSPILKSDTGLLDIIKEDVSKIDLNTLEEMMFIYKLKTLEEMERDIAPQMSMVRENMTEEEIEAAKAKIGTDETVTDDEVKQVMGTAMPEVKKGAEAFKPEVGDADIEKLL